MHYQSPRQVSPEEAAEVFHSDRETEIAETLISTALHISDRQWVEQWLIHFSTHPAPAVRRAAAISVGHLAGIHRQVSPQAVEAVRALLADGGISGAASDALEDVEIFTRKEPG
ncbi:hypothetical protein RKE29_20305 [Streptomyces sp. B1866]|uniref:hypothetical protein n=1 Tax=Streptomyces sp. B1866 TaxID=3075431 RepID=UPI0028920D03|nr:hypothetical protein [Streptomyces sp. B1866]MDT3398957.1 hypothetical protein [Streptomyces sp. B1866]